MFSYIKIRIIVELFLFEFLTAYTCSCPLYYIIERCGYCGVLMNKPAIEVCKPEKHEYIIYTLRDWPI